MNQQESQLVQKNKKWRNRRHQTVGALVLTMNERSGDLRQKANAVTATCKKLHAAKKNLRDAIAEMKNLDKELKEKTSWCEKTAKQLVSTVDRMNASPSVSRENDPTPFAFDLNTFLVRMDAVNMEQRMKKVRDELAKKEKLIVHRRASSSNAQPSQSHVCLPGVKLPDIDSLGNIKKIGSVKIDRTPKCSVCMRNEINCVLCNCAHTCCCFYCATDLMKDEKNNKCPICRSEIKNVIKTYTVV